MSSLINKILLGIIVLCLSGCASAPRPQILQNKSLVKLNCLGEIKGQFGGEALSSPVALEFDPQNNLYIVDKKNNRLVKLRADFQFITETGGFGSGTTALNEPSDIVSDGGINFFVLDLRNRRLIKCDYNLVFSDELKFDDHSELVNSGLIAGIGYSLFGRLILLDPDNLHALMLDTDYVLETELIARGGFSYCSALYVDFEGDIYIYDKIEHAIFHFDGFGNRQEKILLELDGEISDFIISNGIIVATDVRRNELLFYNLNGEVIPVQVQDSSVNLQLSAPQGITLRFDGKIFICDSGNDRIIYYEILP